MKDELFKIMTEGTRAEKQYLYEFDKYSSVDEIKKKFKLFVIGNYPRYLESDWADFHDEMIDNYIKSYLGQINFLNLGFRGCAKTTLLKLFVAFAVLNDKSLFRRYIRINSKEFSGSTQIVTDIYNLIVETESVYGDVFEKDGKTKREEKENRFLLKKGIKVTAGTVGKTQRGIVQDAYRPDWILFDDIEDNESIESSVITKKIIAKCDEAIQGGSVNGTYVVVGNYITDIGVIENFRKKNVIEMITPIIKNNKPMWNRYSLEKIERIKLDAEDWWGDYMCSPQKKDREFNKSWFKEIEYAKIEHLELKRYLTIDSAVKTDENADYTGFSLNLIDREGNWYIKAWHERLNSAELIRKIFYLRDKYRLDKIGLEKTSFTMAIEPFLKEEERRLGKYLNIKELSHGGRNKESRIRGLIGRYTNGKIFHLKGECADLEDELLRFPNSKFDDISDSLAYQLLMIEEESPEIFMGDVDDEQNYL